MAGAFAAWQGTSPLLLVPSGLVVVGVALVLAARRALRRASTTIDRILTEELPPPG